MPIITDKHRYITMNQDKLGFLSTYQGQTRTNTDEHQQTTVSYQIGTLLKISKKI